MQKKVNDVCMRIGVDVCVCVSVYVCDAHACVYAHERGGESEGEII